MMSGSDDDALAEFWERFTPQSGHRSVGTPDGTVSRFAGFCGVCGINQESVVDEVLGMVRATGGFEVKGLWPFWRRFAHHLCENHKTAMNLVADRRAAVRRLLEKAIALDPRSKVAKSNLDTLRKMSM